MKQLDAWELRHIFQCHIGPVLQKEHLRRLFAAMADMDEEEMEALDRLAGDIGSHLLDRLVE